MGSGSVRMSAIRNNWSKVTGKQPVCSISRSDTIGSKTIVMHRKARSRSATARPIRPKPTIPTVSDFSACSLSRGAPDPHRPPRTRSRCAMSCRVRASINPSVWSATSSMQ